MIDFGILTKDQAKLYCKNYAAGVPLRANWLMTEVQATESNLSVMQDKANLDELWSWLHDRILIESPTQLVLLTPLPEDDPQTGRRPPWASPDEPNPYLSDGLLWIIEAIGCHLAVLMKAQYPKIYWDIYEAPRSFKDVNQYRTMLYGAPVSPVDPARMVYGGVIDNVIHNNKWDPGALSAALRYVT